MQHRITALVMVLCSQSIAYTVQRVKTIDSPIEPTITVRLNDAANPATVSRETINHVHHQHEHTIGNLHILTHINIANVVSVLNASGTSATGAEDKRVGGVTAMALTNDSAPNANNINAPSTEQQHIKRNERKRHAHQRPFRFPNRIEENGASELQLIRWPVDQPPNYAVETAPRHGNHLSAAALGEQQRQRHRVRFPAVQAESENDAPDAPEHINFAKIEPFVGPASPADRKDERPTASTTPPTPALPSLLHQNTANNYGIQIGRNDVDNGTSTVNQTASAGTIEAVRPMIYTVAEHGQNTAMNSATNATGSSDGRVACRTAGASALPSINCPTKTEAAIIFNEHQVLASTQQHPSIPITAPNTIAATAAMPNVLFNAQMAINLPNAHVERQTNRTGTQRSGPQLFGGLPIIV